MPPQTPTPSPAPTTPPMPAPPVNDSPLASIPAPATMPAAPLTPAPMQLNPAYGHDKMATASLVLGIISLPSAIIPILTLPIPITAIVLGIISMKQKKSFAMAGIALGILGIILSAVSLGVGLKYQNDQKKSGLIDSSSNLGVNGSTLTSSCYSFTLPDDFITNDVIKNSDCYTTIINPGDSDDVQVNYVSLAKDILASDQDEYLKNLAAEFEIKIGVNFQATSRKFIDIDGSRAYQVYGTETSGKYRYAGFILMVAPKEYFSVTGETHNIFSIAYDSANSQDRLDQIAQSWHWQ